MAQFIDDKKFQEVMEDFKELINKHDLRNLEIEVLFTAMIAVMKAKKQKDQGTNFMNDMLSRLGLGSVS